MSSNKLRTIQPQKRGRAPRVHRDRLDCIRGKARQLTDLKLHQHAQKAVDPKVLRIYLEEMLHRSLILQLIHRNGTFTFFLVKADDWMSVQP